MPSYQNGLHYRRDRSMREDDSQLRLGHAPHLLAILNNTVLGLFARRGETNLPHAQRTFAYQFDRALARLPVKGEWKTLQQPWIPKYVCLIH